MFVSRFDSTAPSLLNFEPPTDSWILKTRKRHLFELWNAVRIERASRFGLFTFGESELPYFLVLQPQADGKLVSLRQGKIKISRPTIITPGNAAPEFQNFFEDADGSELAKFLLSRSAAFSHLKFDNSSFSEKSVSDSVEETVAKLMQRLDEQEEDGTAILSAPHALGWMALMRYAAERVVTSAPDNVQELRERGFLDF